METLKWNTHVQSLAKKLSMICFMIKVSTKEIEPIRNTKYLFFKISIVFTAWNNIVRGMGII
jgi:hypothetical protein